MIYIYIHVIDCYIVIANNSIILKTLKMIICIHFEEYCCYNITETLHHARKKRVILGGERVLYTWPSLIAFRRMHGSDAVLEGHRPWAHFPPCVSLSLWPSGFRIDFGWRCSKYLWFVVCLVLVWLFAVSLAASWPAGLCISLPPWLLDALLAWLKAWWHHNISCLCTQLAHWYVI